MEPAASIIINNYNYAAFLTRSIESALAQTAPGVEVVVVDDASVDRSREIIRGYGERIVAVLREVNGGQGAAINAGFRACKGQVVLFLDADDFLYPRAVAEVLSRWRPGVSKVHYRLDLVDRAERKIALYPSPEVQLDSGDVVPRLLRTGHYETPVMSGNAFSRAVLERILPVPEGDFRISADGYLVTIAPFHGPVIAIDEPLGAYRQHGNNAWSLGGTLTESAAIAQWMRRLLGHDELKHRALAEAARRFGRELGPAPGLRDPQHLAYRLGSMCLDPGGHPYPGDSRALLGVRGALASLQARTPWPRRAGLVAWFLAVGTLPRPLGSRVAAWRLAPASRPPSLARALKLARRLLRGRRATAPGNAYGDSSSSTQSF
jgi:hypothetical protein